jgi:hypothetical protein
MYRLHYVQGQEDYEQWTGRDRIPFQGSTAAFAKRDWGKSHKALMLPLQTEEQRTFQVRSQTTY